MTTRQRFNVVLLGILIVATLVWLTGAALFYVVAPAGQAVKFVIAYIKLTGLCGLVMVIPGVLLYLFLTWEFARIGRNVDEAVARASRGIR